MTNSVYLVWHSHDLEQETELKVLGVYSTEGKAEQRVTRAKAEPGFRDFPDQFFISEYELDEDLWIDGYRTLGPEDNG